MRSIKVVPFLLIRLPAKIIRFALFVARKSRLIILVSLYGVHSFITFWWRIPLLGILVKIPTAKLAYFVQRIMMMFNKRGTSIDSINLMRLAVRNMRYKRTRSSVTIGGMAIGIGAIVFLVSLGYGTQRMVVNRVARLEELRQADITTQAGSSVRINDRQLRVIKDIQGVSQVLPLISVVGRVNYQNSISDMVVYGVTADYLRLSAIRPIQGTIFKNNDVARVISYENELLNGDVAGATVMTQKGKRGEVIGNVNYSIEPEKWIRLRADASVNSQIVGYTRRVEGQVVGKLVWGGTYGDNAFGRIEVTDPQTQQTATLGKWLKASFPVWEKKPCDPVNVGCDSSGSYMRQRESNGDFVHKEAYTALIHVSITGNPITSEHMGQVLGETETTASNIQTIDVSQITATGSAKLLLAEIASESAALTENVKKVGLGKQAVKQAVVNRAALSVLGIEESQAVGQEFEVSFVITGNLLADSQSKVESVPARYRIVGVVPENNTPFFYVPFIDLRSLGIDNFTQAKLVSKSQAELGQIRQKVESLGFSTESVVDTVDQIERLFSTIRMALITVGMIALGVAALGMFNTLTVSLLERTHEVGLMKTMGMKSNEVEDLFLTESVAMGLFGGLAGVVLGFIAGKITSLALTILALRSGAGVIDVSDIPLSLIALVLGMSLTVGLLTGIYPARRAKKISALNALRYE